MDMSPLTHLERTSLRPAHALASAALALLVLAAQGCMPLPEQGGLAVSAGPMSDQWVIQWDKALLTPTAMTNRSLQDTPAPGGAATVSDSAAEAAVRAVFSQHSDWFRLRPGVDDFRVVRVYPRGWLKFLRIEQRYKGVPVAGMGYDARVFAGGRVGSLEGRFYPNLEMVTTPTLTANQAEERALAAFGGNVSSRPAAPFLQYEYEHGFTDPRILVIVPQGDLFALAWGVLVRTPPQGYSRVYVNATDGSILGYQMVGTNWQR